MKKIVLTAAMALIVLSGSAQEKKDSTVKKNTDYEFTVIKENPITSIKDQYRSATCG